MADLLPDGVVQQIRDALFAGQKIGAIKLYREATGLGLKEAKDFIDALEAKLRAAEPERFTGDPGGKGCGLAVVCFGLLAVLVWQGILG